MKNLSAPTVGAAIALGALCWGIFIWLSDRKQKARESAGAAERERAATAQREAEEVVVLIERGAPLEDGLPTWNVAVSNHRRQPIRGVEITYSIQAWLPLPREEGQVGQRHEVGPWQGPHTIVFQLAKGGGQTTDQQVFWEGPVDEVHGPTLLGAKFVDHRGRFWVRGQDDGWRSVEADEFNTFQPQVPQT